MHHRTLDDLARPRGRFVALYGDRDHAVWLDSARAEPGLARFSFMGAPDGPLGQVVRYDVADAARSRSIAPAGARSCARACSTTASASSPACGPTRPELPFDFTCGFAGYLGYELKADAAARSCTAPRCPTPRSCSATG